MSIWPAFIRGVWFDNVIACYILLIPLVAVSISALFNYYGKILWNVTCIFFSLFYGIVLLVTAANIPYFQYFFKIINSFGLQLVRLYEYDSRHGIRRNLLLPSFDRLSIDFSVIYLAHATIDPSFSTFTKYKKSVCLLARPYLYLPDSCICIGLCLFGIRGRTGIIR